MTETPGSDSKTIWYVVGGGCALIVMCVICVAVIAGSYFAITSLATPQFEPLEPPDSPLVSPVAPAEEEPPEEEEPVEVVTEEPVVMPDTIEVMTSLSGSSAAALVVLNDIFAEETGVNVDLVEGSLDYQDILTVRVAAGDPPDIAVGYPDPFFTSDLEYAVESGLVVDLSSFMDMDYLQDAYHTDLLDALTFDGHLWGVFLDLTSTGTYWYNPAALESSGYWIPETWEDLTTLQETISADGATTWCLGFESGVASGWPGAHMVENFLLASGGPEVFHGLANGDYNWTSPEVRAAWEYFGEIAMSEENTFGGPEGALSTNFLDAPAGMYTSPPDCYFYYLGSFSSSWLAEWGQPGSGYQVASVPVFNAQVGRALAVNGTIINAFTDNPGTRAYLDYLTSIEAQNLWATETTSIAANNYVTPDIYTDPVYQRLAEIFQQTDVMALDLDLLMPDGYTFDTLFPAVVDYLNGVPLEDILRTLDDAMGQ